MNTGQPPPGHWHAYSITPHLRRIAVARAAQAIRCPPTWTSAACAEPPLSHRAPTKPFCGGMNTNRPPRPWHANSLTPLTVCGGAVGTGGAIFPPTWKPAACAEPPAKSQRTSTNKAALSLAAHPDTYPGVHISIGTASLARDFANGVPPAKDRLPGKDCRRIQYHSGHTDETPAADAMISFQAP